MGRQEEARKQKNEPLISVLLEIQFTCHMAEGSLFTWRKKPLMENWGVSCRWLGENILGRLSPGAAADLSCLSKLPPGCQSGECKHL